MKGNIECGVCKEKISLDNYSSHASSCLYRQYIRKSGKEYQCVICQIKVSKRSILYNHLKKGHPEGRGNSSCAFCKQKFFQGCLKSHINKHINSCKAFFKPFFEEDVLTNTYECLMCLLKIKQKNKKYARNKMVEHIRYCHKSEFFNKNKEILKKNEEGMEKSDDNEGNLKLQHQNDKIMQNKSRTEDDGETKLPNLLETTFVPRFFVFLR